MGKLSYILKLIIQTLDTYFKGYIGIYPFFVFQKVKGEDIRYT